MEYARQCFCDNYVRNGGALTQDSDCNMPCTGNSTEMCGAGDRLTVYSNAPLQVFQPPVVQTTNLTGNWQYVGCITDSVGARTFPYQIENPSNNSANNCLSVCAQYGFAAGGMEYGQECYCGDVADVALAGATTQPDSDCSMSCPGDPRYLCGAGNRISYYQWVGSGMPIWNYPTGPAAGQYSFLIGGPVVPLMTTQMVNNKVQMLEKWPDTGNTTGAYEFDRSQISNFSAAFRTLHVQTDIFCGAAFIMPDKVGRVLSIGGWSDADNSLYGVRTFWPSGALGTPGTTDWQENFNEVKLQAGRWYPGAMVMSNGSFLVMGGEDGSNGPPVPNLEVLPTPAGGYLKYCDYLKRTDPYNLYPYMNVLPSGGILIMYYNEGVILDPVTLDPVRNLTKIPGAVNNPLGGRSYPLEGSTALMPQIAPYTDPLTVLVCGGSTPGPSYGIDNCVSTQPDVIGANWTIERMPSKRVISSMCALPDGTYLIINGAHDGTAGFGLGNDPNLNAVLYDPTKPVNARMSVMANTTIARMYHNEAILLSDGSVLISGSDPKDNRYPEEYRLELFSPPYLLKGLARPSFSMDMSQRDWAYGQSYTIYNVQVSNGPISALNISIMGAEASTHGNSYNQRTIFPAFSCSGTTCTITAPPNSFICPPTWAQLFILDGGMPSNSTYIRIGGDPSSLGNWPNFPDFDVPGMGAIDLSFNGPVKH